MNDVRAGPDGMSGVCQAKRLVPRRETASSAIVNTEHLISTARPGRSAVSLFATAGMRCSKSVRDPADCFGAGSVNSVTKRLLSWMQFSMLTTGHHSSLTRYGSRRSDGKHAVNHRPVTHRSGRKLLIIEFYRLMAACIQRIMLWSVKLDPRHQTGPFPSS